MTNCSYCNKDITYKNTYYLSLNESCDFQLCQECYNVYYNEKLKKEQKKVKYTKFTRFEIMDI